VATLNLGGVSLRAVELARLLHLLETVLSTLLSLLAVVGVGDGGLCKADQRATSSYV
jgi:hypothetical protein